MAGRKHRMRGVVVSLQFDLCPGESSSLSGPSYSGRAADASEIQAKITEAGDRPGPELTPPSRGAPHLGKRGIVSREIYVRRAAKNRSRDATFAVELFFGWAGIDGRGPGVHILLPVVGELPD